MTKKQFSSNNIKYLPNIIGLDAIRDNLFKATFQQNPNSFTRTTEDKALTQEIKILENIEIKQSNQTIKKLNLQGQLFKTTLLGDILRTKPLPLSARKQTLIEMLAKMNNGNLNEAEGINLVYSSQDPEGPLLDTKKLKPLSPNFCSQLASSLHFNQKSRLTLGESHLINPKNKMPFGSSILQISHLTYHALDIDLSTGVTPDNTVPIDTSAIVHEYCFTIPYSLKKSSYSKHGYILTLSGNNITPEAIQKILGLKNNAVAGVAIISGQAESSILNCNTSFYMQKKQQIIKESICTFISDPSNLHCAKGLLVSDQAGNINSINGEVVIILFPLLQSFTFQYSKNISIFNQSE